MFILTYVSLFKYLPRKDHLSCRLICVNAYWETHNWNSPLYLDIQGNQQRGTVTAHVAELCCLSQSRKGHRAWLTLQGPVPQHILRTWWFYAMSPASLTETAVILQMVEHQQIRNISFEKTYISLVYKQEFFQKPRGIHSPSRKSIIPNWKSNSLLVGLNYFLVIVFLG